MPSEQTLSWLNSSVQLILPNNFFIDKLSQHDIFLSNNANIPLRAIGLGSQDNSTAFSDFFSKMEEITLKYLCYILKLPPGEKASTAVIKKYIQDLREYGPKFYSTEKQEYIPLIQPIDKSSSIYDYIPNVLLSSATNFIDVRVVWNHSFKCNRCRSINVASSDNQSVLKLSISDCDGTSLPDAALEKFFAIESSGNFIRCGACGRESNKDAYGKEMVQLPDTLFLSFVERQSNASNDGKNVNSKEYFIKSYLDVSKFCPLQMMCHPSYFKYRLKSVMVNTEDANHDLHYYTFARYGEQFFRCDGELVEAVDRSVVLDRKYSFSYAMYTREKADNVNFVETIYRIVFSEEKFQLPSSYFNSHQTMMFDAALEHVADSRKALCWTYGAVYTCSKCKQSEFSHQLLHLLLMNTVLFSIVKPVFCVDCVLFANEEHIRNDGEISLDDILLQPKLLPQLRCDKQCSGHILTKYARYGIFDTPKFIFVTLDNTPNKETSSKLTKAMTTTENDRPIIHPQIYVKCDLKQICFTYKFWCFIVTTRTGTTMIVKQIDDKTYAAYNNDSKSYEPLPNFQLDDYIKASGAKIAFCYKNDGSVNLNPEVKVALLKTDDWLPLDMKLDFETVTEQFKKYFGEGNSQLEIGPYRLKSNDLLQLVESTHPLNDEQLNAHLHLTTTIGQNVLLFDSIQFAKYCRRGFRNSSQITDKNWFTYNIVLIPVHHSNHWFLFTVDITKKTVILFDSLPSIGTPHGIYLEEILQLLRTYHLYVGKPQLEIDEWTLIHDFSGWEQDDQTSCGIHCAFFARSYVTSTKHPPINHKNIKTMRTKFALHLLEHKRKRTVRK